MRSWIEVRFRASSTEAAESLLYHLASKLPDMFVQACEIGSKEARFIGITRLHTTERSPTDNPSIIVLEFETDEVNSPRLRLCNWALRPGWEVVRLTLQRLITNNILHRKQDWSRLSVFVWTFVPEELFLNGRDLPL